MYTFFNPGEFEALFASTTMLDALFFLGTRPARYTHLHIVSYRNGRPYTPFFFLFDDTKRSFATPSVHR